MSSEQRQYSIRSSFSVKYDTEGCSIPTNPDYIGCSICALKSHFRKYCPLNPSRVDPEQYPVAIEVPNNSLVVPTNSLVEGRGIYIIYQFRGDDSNAVKHGHAQIDTGADTDFMSYTTCCRLRLQDRLTNHDGLGCSLQRAGRYHGRLENVRLFLGTPGAEEEVVVISPMVHDHPDIDILIGCPTCENEGWILAPRDNTINGPNNLYITTYPSVNIVNQQMEKFSDAVGTQDEHLTDEQQGADLYPENIPSPMPTSMHVASPDMNYFSMPLQQVSLLVTPFPALHDHMPAMAESISENPMEDFNVSMPLRPATAPGTNSTIDTTTHGNAPNGGTLSPLYGFFDGHDVEMQHVQDTQAAICVPDPQSIPPMPSMATPLTSLTWFPLQQSRELSTVSPYNSMSILQPPILPPAQFVWDFAAATGELNPPSEIVEVHRHLPSDMDASSPTVPVTIQQYGYDHSVSSMFHEWNMNPPNNNELIFVLESGLPSVAQPRRPRRNQSTTSPIPPPCDRCIQSGQVCDLRSPCTKCQRMDLECVRSRMASVMRTLKLLFISQFKCLLDECLLGVARSREFDSLQQYFVPGFTDDVEMQGKLRAIFW
ncbi:hypothetical protein BC938DRAFT_474783 [Jimgerdemannia flammicorona]|uniref:Zn(2)-C6 fungal-type domain-containing protein n=1 Tax=Jimgerdemannia flammicorona TaxID=994334 RepID=A0A433QS89_9FUNG|nr:hypothetical protein BC938DRAFT_474783 [Jimgerdemannia flammicorona]